MPNLHDCPREIRDQIYETYFATSVSKNPDAALHRNVIFLTNRSLATEAAEAANRVMAVTVTDSKAKSEEARVEAMSEWHRGEKAGRYVVVGHSWAAAECKASDAEKRLARHERVWAELVTLLRVLREMA